LQIAEHIEAVVKPLDVLQALGAVDAGEMTRGRLVSAHRLDAIAEARLGDVATRVKVKAGLIIHCPRISRGSLLRLISVIVHIPPRIKW
jgi:hypothetical protein